MEEALTSERIFTWKRTESDQGNVWMLVMSSWSRHLLRHVVGRYVTNKLEMFVSLKNGGHQYKVGSMWGFIALVVNDFLPGPE